MKITETKFKKNIDALYQQQSADACDPGIKQSTGAILETKGGGTEIDDTNSADRIGEKIGQEPSPPCFNYTVIITLFTLLLQCLYWRCM